MKASKLLTGLSEPLAQDLILYNALMEVDRLEERERALKQQIRHYENVFQQLRAKATCYHSEASDCLYIMFDSVYERFEEKLFADLMELLQLEEPEEENKDEVD